MTSLGVVEIFDSIEGEGIRTGMPVTFIRLAGCNLRCSYCDTCYAQKETDGELMSIDDIIKKVNYNAVTITGGEPLLHQQSVLELINKLNYSGHYVNIETNCLPKAYTISVEINVTIKLKISLKAKVLLKWA